MNRARGHEVVRADELGWQGLENRALLDAAEEAGFDLLGANCLQHRDIDSDDLPAMWIVSRWLTGRNPANRLLLVGDEGVRRVFGERPSSDIIMLCTKIGGVSCTA